MDIDTFNSLAHIFQAVKFHICRDADEHALKLSH
jgi:hypothetical protein